MTMTTKLRRIQLVPIFQKLPMNCIYSYMCIHYKTSKPLLLNVAADLGRKSSLFDWRDQSSAKFPPDELNNLLAPVQFGDPTFIMTHSPKVLPLNTTFSRACFAGSACAINGGSNGVNSVVAVTCSNLVATFSNLVATFSNLVATFYIVRRVLSVRHTKNSLEPLQ
jgi:hypothetical protein